MLTYAFEYLKDSKFKELDAEDFENMGDLMASILVKCLTILIKRGLESNYLEKEEDLLTVKGKIDINKTIKTQSLQSRHRIYCNYDEYTVNNKKNQIIKSTVYLLLQLDINKQIKSKLRGLMLYFKDISLIDLNFVDWNMLYNKNNQIYRTIIAICYFIKKGLIQNNNDGSYKLMDFINYKEMDKIYEKFILKYYQKEFPCISAKASKIKWQLDDDNKDFLPEMRTDITLEKNNTVLIIDAKFYHHTTVDFFNKKSLITNNLYQIFTYVKNKEVELKDVSHKVSGMLLYAKTDEEVVPNEDYMMSGNLISAKNLDLSVSFEEIKNQLNNIVYKYFDLKKIEE